MIAIKGRRPDRTGEHRTAFEKNRKIVLQTQNICGICGKEIDRSFKYPHPLSATVDHIVPVAKGGHPSALSNLQAAHRWCNRWKSDKLVESLLREQGTIGRNSAEDAGLGLPQYYDWAAYRPDAGEADGEKEAAKE